MPVANQLEAALKSLMAGAGLSNINTGQSAEDLDAASYVVDVTQGDEFPQDTGNYRVKASVELQTPGDKDNAGTSPLAGHLTAFDALRAALDTDDLPSRLSGAVAGLYVFANSITGRGVTSGTQGRLFVSKWEFDCVACEADLT
jgi:hypothetical protein